MPKVKVMHYEGEPMRMVFIENRWWVFAQDASDKIDDRMNEEKLFANTPEDEKRLAHIASGRPVRVVSARHLIRRLENSLNYDRARFRAWLKAWKIISGAKSANGGS